MTVNGIDPTVENRLAAVERLLREAFTIHDEPCRADHHGYCQEHHLQLVADCWVGRARVYFEEREAEAARGAAAP